MPKSRGRRPQRGGKKPVRRSPRPLRRSDLMLRDARRPRSLKWAIEPLERRLPEAARLTPRPRGG